MFCLNTKFGFGYRREGILGGVRLLVSDECTSYRKVPRDTCFTRCSVCLRRSVGEIVVGPVGRVRSGDPVLLPTPTGATGTRHGDDGAPTSDLGPGPVRTTRVS